MDEKSIIFGFIAGFLLGGVTASLLVIIFYKFKIKLLTEKENKALNEKILSFEKEKVSLVTTLEKEREGFEEKIYLLNESKQELTNQFKNLANDILEENSKKFTDRNKENLEFILNPLKERILEFKSQVDKSNKDNTIHRTELLKELEKLKEQNKQISDDANNLADAIKGDPKQQGMWGELILKRVLEQSGLEEGREFEVEQTIKNEDGKNFRPDIVIHLPDSKSIVIDSKVSLKDYNDFYSKEDSEEKKNCLEKHKQSIRNHVINLSNKDYSSLKALNTVDFVIMFIPIESALSEALKYDNGIYDFSLQKNIVIATPTTLLATLRTIEMIWRNEYQNQNTIEIAEKAGALYDKFVGFIDDMDKLGNSIQKSQEIYNDAFKKLSKGSGNLVKRTEDMKKLGLKTKKSLPESITSEAGI